MEPITPNTALPLSPLSTLPQILTNNPINTRALVNNAVSVQLGNGTSAPTDWEISTFNALNSFNMPQLLRTIETTFPNILNSQNFTVQASQTYKTNLINRLRNYNNQIQNQSLTNIQIKEANGNPAVLINVDRIEYAINVVDNYKLPMLVGDLEQTGQVKDAADYIASKLSSNASYRPIISKILIVCNRLNVISKRQISYILSTAENESGFRPVMEGYGRLQPTTFIFDHTLAAYYFTENRSTGKASYNSTSNNNVSAGDELIQKGVQLSPNEKAALNGTQVYPKALILNLISQNRITENDIQNCDFYRYAGKGFVQITWQNNYSRFGSNPQINADLVNHPELALDIDTAINILVLGMTIINFTGVVLSRFLDDLTKSDWINARKVVNGLDRAQDFANSAQGYYRNMKGR